jgi:hypothetical protein
MNFQTMYNTMKTAIAAPKKLIQARAGAIGRGYFSYGWSNDVGRSDDDCLSSEQ